MSNTEWFIIPNLEEFTDKVRSIVYNNFGAWDNVNTTNLIINNVKDSEKGDLDKLLSYQESLVIIKENIKTQRNKITKDKRYVLNDEIFADIVHKLNERMVSNIISSLVQKGLVETAFDEKANDFVFWVKNDEKEIEKPETD